MCRSLASLTQFTLSISRFHFRSCFHTCDQKVEMVSTIDILRRLVKALPISPASATCSQVCSSTRIIVFITKLIITSFYARLQRCEEPLLVSSCPSTRPSAWDISVPTCRIVMKFDVWLFLVNLLEKFEFHFNQTKIMSTVHEDLCTFIISRSFFPRMRKIWDRSCRN
jgi:hypothetical protein